MRLLLFTVFAEHGEEPEFCGLRQKLVMSFEPGLLIRQFQMNVEILASSPIFVEVKDVRIFFADVKVIVNAASLGPRTVDKTAQKFDQFSTFFWSGVQSSCEGATWFHNFCPVTISSRGEGSRNLVFPSGTRRGVDPHGPEAPGCGRAKDAAFERALQ